MKTLKLIFAFFASTALIVSCSKDDETTPNQTTYPEENFYQTFLTNSGLNNPTNVIDFGSNYEGGLRFKPTVNGKITKIFIKLPANQTDVRITIWDVASQSALRTETVTNVIADTETSKSITPLALEINKEYLISFNSNDWYQRDRTSGTIPYPITAGSIVILGYQSLPTVSQSYPVLTSTTATAGDLSFSFQRTE